MPVPASAAKANLGQRQRHHQGERHAGEGVFDRMEGAREWPGRRAGLDRNRAAHLAVARCFR